MRINLILLAAGFSKRFGENKLLFQVDQVPMYRYILDKLVLICTTSKNDITLTVVTQYPQIKEVLDKEHITCIMNHESQKGISSSLQLGILSVAPCTSPQCYAFFVGDQPYLSYETVDNFLKSFLHCGKGIGCLTYNKTLGNPVIFTETYVPELMALSGDTGGKRVLKKHMDDVFLFEAQQECELKDIDTLQEYELKNFGTLYPKNNIIGGSL